jgi:hypothetical protein
VKDETYNILEMDYDTLRYPSLASDLLATIPTYQKVGQLTSFSAPYAGARAPRGGVTRQGVVLTDLQSLLDCQ